MQIIRKTVKNIPFYACDGFGPGVVHGFSTRIGGVSPAPWDSLNLGACRGDDPANLRENFSCFCAAIGADPNALVKNQQMHSKRVRPVTKADVMPAPETPGEVEADGMITNQPGVALTIFSGDCLPVFLYDPVRRVIAACHAGWRGTAQGIAAQAARQMQEDPPGYFSRHRAGHRSLLLRDPRRRARRLTGGAWPRRGGVYYGPPRRGEVSGGPEGGQRPLAGAGGPEAGAYRPLRRLHRLRPDRFLVPPDAGEPAGKHGGNYTNGIAW